MLLIAAPAAHAGTLSFSSLTNEDGPPTRFWVFEAKAGAIGRVRAIVQVSAICAGGK